MNLKIAVSLIHESDQTPLFSALKKAGFSTRLVGTADDLIETLRQEPVVLIVLDLEYCVRFHLDLLRFVRELAPAGNLIVLSHRKTPESILKALRCQVFDYLTSPVTERRWSRSLQRISLPVGAQEAAGDELLTDELEHEAGVFVRFDGTRIDLRKRIITWREGQVRLTASEAKLLTVFLKNPGRVLPHAQLVRMVQGYEISDAEAPFIMRPLVSRLRQKVAYAPGGNEWIVNIRGSGYMYERRSHTLV